MAVADAIHAMPAGRGKSWQDVRDRILASSRFQRFASAFPLTRPVARRRARALIDLFAGFVYSQVLAACVRLRLFEHLADGPLGLAVLSDRLALPLEATERLLAAAVALRLASRRGAGRYGLGPLGAAMLGNPGVAAMVEHHAMLYADLRDPVALLRGQAGETELGRYWPYAGGGAVPEASEVAAYSTLMGASQPLVAEDVLAAYDVRRHRCLLDVGGGDGRFLIAAAARAPELQLKMFDLPAVAERARAALQTAGLGERASVVGGDLHADALPTGADLVSLVRVVHDHDDAAALGILRRVHDALPPGGALLLAEPMSGTPGAEPVGDAYFGFYLLAMGSGRPRTPQVLRALLAQAGFARSRLLRTRRPMLVRAIVAHRSTGVRNV
jgi:demethylspheroidene O-methyltransferase